MYLKYCFLFPYIFLAQSISISDNFDEYIVLNNVSFFEGSSIVLVPINYVDGEFVESYQFNLHYNLNDFSPLFEHIKTVNTVLFLKSFGIQHSFSHEGMLSSNISESKGFESILSVAYATSSKADVNGVLLYIPFRSTEDIKSFSKIRISDVLVNGISNE